MLPRRVLLAAGLVAALGTSPAAAAARQLRIGYQKSGSLALTRRQGVIEAALRPVGATVTWTEFPAGPPIMEALSAGAIDIGYAGDAPPVFAQAAGAELLYAAATSGGSNAAILLPPGSTLQALGELKGRRVAFARGSSAHNLVVAALETAGLAPSDIQPVHLAPSDAAAAFRSGAVDAWAIWDPYYAVAEAQPGVRVLARSVDIAPENTFLLVSRAAARADPELVGLAMRALGESGAWAEAHRDELAQVLSETTGVPLDAMRRAVARAHYGFAPMDAGIVAQQQAVADRFRRLRLIPAEIAVADALWHPAS